MKKEILLFFTSLVLILNIRFILASNIIEDTFMSFNSGIMGFILSLIPLAILFAVTILAIKKANTILLTIQILLWLIFAFYTSIKAIAFLDLFLNFELLPKAIIEFFAINNIPTDPNINFWFVLSIFINAGVGIFMLFGNNKLRRFFIKIK